MITTLFAIALVSFGTPQNTAAAEDSKASESAKSFSLDLGKVPTDDAVTAPAEPATPVPVEDAVTMTPAAPVPPVPEPPTSIKAEAAVPVSPALFSLDTPIGQLVADPRARAVLDKDLPGLSTDENLPKFRALSLRKFQPLTGGQLTDALLAQAEVDLAEIKPSASKAPTGKRKLDSR